MVVSTYLLIFTLNWTWLHAPIKRHRVVEWIKNMTHLYASYKRLTWIRKTHTDWKWTDEKKIFHANRNKKRAEVVILISDKKT